MAYQIVMYKEKRIGIYDTEKNIYIKHGVKKSKHLFKKMDAWGVDQNTFENILKPECRIIIEEVEERKRYETTHEKMKAEGEYLNFGEHALQIFLPREKWTVTNM